MNMTSHNEGKKFPAAPLTREEVMRLMGVCSRRASTGLRDRALIAVMWRGQLRVSEALSLRPGDVDMVGMTVRVLRGKGDRSRLVVVDKGTVEVMGVWMERRRSLGLNGHQPLFCTLAGGMMSTAQVREMLPRRARKAGIEKRCHAHGLRHTGASELAAESVPIIEVMEQLGHANLGTTQRYLHQLNPVARVERLSKREW